MIPSKGMFESHENELLNRNRFCFFTFFFSWSWEFSSTYLCKAPASALPAQSNALLLMLLEFDSGRSWAPCFL